MFFADTGKIYSPHVPRIFNTFNFNFHIIIRQSVGKFFSPLDKNNPLRKIRILIKADVLEFVLVLQAIQIKMDNRAKTLVNVHQVKSRAGDFALNAQSSRHTLHEKSFPRAQNAFKTNYRSLSNTLSNFFCQFYRPVRGLRYVSKQKIFISSKIFIISANIINKIKS